MQTDINKSNFPIRNSISKKRAFRKEGHICNWSEKFKKKPGNHLLSHRLAAVPSARERFTYVFGMGTCISTPLWSPGRFTVIGKTCSQWGQSVSEPKRQYGQASRLISTGRLNASLHLHLRPINQVVCLVPSVDSRSKGFLILRRASHLDAFSGYPFRTWPPGTCAWQHNRYTRGSSSSVLSY